MNSEVWMIPAVLLAFAVAFVLQSMVERYVQAYKFEWHVGVVLLVGVSLSVAMCWFSRCCHWTK